MSNHAGFPALLMLVLASFSLSAQNNSDSTRVLKEVTITTSNLSESFQLNITGATSVINKNQLQDLPQTSLVGALNMAAGVRMEERSPGSYRLSIRGSLLRSPFGIRNVKIYLDDFPLTDAGGNTYLNLIDASLVNAIMVLKGPQASIFGANTGGAVLVETTASRPENELYFSGGSYGLLHQSAKFSEQFHNYRFQISEGFQQSDGYRENSALRRKYVQTSHIWDYHKNGQLKFLLFYSDLAYETPGGLTAAQVMADPAAARPATTTIPGATAQQAGIYNKTIFGGLANRLRLSDDFQFIVALFGSNTDFKNPFITNYEKRRENTLGVRSFINFQQNKDPDFTFDAYLGIESSRTGTAIDNFGNDKGNPAALQASDKLTAQQDFAFIKANLKIYQFSIDLGTSLNLFRYRYQSFAPVYTVKSHRKFNAEIMPKLGISYLFNQNLSWRATAARGYSPPTLAEVRASDNVINNDLQAESGWNYETGLVYRNKDRRFMVDANVFYFNLQDAIVRRLTSTDAEYFLNAGGTKQLGTEIQLSWQLLKSKKRILVEDLTLSGSYSYSRFKFDDFRNDTQNFSGNWLTGVPKHVMVGGLNLTLIKGFYTFAQHQYTSAIPLNDANTVFSKNYHLTNVKLGNSGLALGRLNFDLSGAVNNIFNATYSLGNDLNAANGRYFNPAAGVNYEVSLKVRF